MRGLAVFFDAIGLSPAMNFFEASDFSKERIDSCMIVYQSAVVCRWTGGDVCQMKLAVSAAVRDSRRYLSK